MKLDKEIRDHQRNDEMEENKINFNNQTKIVHKLTGWDYNPQDHTKAN